MSGRPTLRWRAPKREPLVPAHVQGAAPALAGDFAVLERELLPQFYVCDEGALHAQNSFRLAQLLVISGGALATFLGTIQAAFGPGVATVGIAEAVVAGTLAGVVAYVRGLQTQREYFTMRLKTERLRSEYFLFLGRNPPYESEDERERRRLLREQLRTIEAERPA